MNAYIHELSACLKLYRSNFEINWFVSRGAPDEDIAYLRRHFADELAQKWLEYSASSAFDTELAACKRAARKKVSWMTDADTQQMSACALHHIESSENRKPLKVVDCDSVDNNPFDPRYYPTLPYYADRVVYKPGHVRYENTEGMDAYLYFGNKLASIGRDALASTWIAAHGNDTD